MRSLCIKKPFELDVDVIRYFSKNRMKIKNVKFVRKNLVRKIESIIAFPRCFFGLFGFWIWTDQEHRESNMTVLCPLGWK